MAVTDDMPVSVGNLKAVVDKIGAGGGSSSSEVARRQ